MKKGKNLGHLGERNYLKQLLPSLKSTGGAALLVPPGDDAAVLKSTGRPVLSIDGLTENTHFRLRWSAVCRTVGGFPLARGLGWKLMGSGLSDLAAMGRAANRWAMTFLGAPGGTPLSFLNDLKKGVLDAARAYDCAVVGGDTVRAEKLSLVVAVGAEAGHARPLTRSGARAGDVICIAGTVGDAAAGLDILERRSPVRSSMDRNFFIRRFFKPAPMFDAGKILSEEKTVTALMDLSDALKDSIEIIAEMSGVGAELHLEAVPISKPYARNFPRTPHLLLGGEDYTLLFTMKPSGVRRLARKLEFAVVGRTVPKRNGVKFFHKGRPLKRLKAFEHFQ